MPVNSRAKGKRGELEAVKYLKSLGFADARRTQQYNGLGKGDVICPESLPGLNIEVKFGVTGMDLGTNLFESACIQAQRDSTMLRWALLWKPQRSRQWRVTAHDDNGFQATYCHDGEIQAVLLNAAGLFMAGVE